jgi:hypothetical protein
LISGIAEKCHGMIEFGWLAKSLKAQGSGARRVPFDGDGGRQDPLYAT